MLQDEIEEVENGIILLKDVKEGWISFLKTLDKKEILAVFFRLYNKFIDNKELDEKEIKILEILKTSLNLTNEDVNYFDDILPYLYVNAVRTGKKLPVLSVKREDGGQIVLKKGEETYCADNAVLKEMKSVSLGYKGGSTGFSFRIAKGVNYRIGGHRGHVVKEDRFVETSRGILLLTNKRLFMSPYPGNKPLNIPLNKILSHNCFDNGIEVYKEGREKGYFLSLGKSGSVEIFGICLGHLFNQ